MNFRTIEISDAFGSSNGIRFVTVKSQALKSRVDVSFYIPETAKNQSNVPVVILLHGVYGSHWVWLYKGQVHTTLESLIKQAESEAFILVMPSDGLVGDGTGYVNSEGQGFETWIAEELPILVEQTVNEVSHSSQFFITGLSMGGYGAFRIGLLYPDRFKGISGHSSMTDIRQMKLFVEEDWSDWDQYTLGSVESLLLQKNKVPPIRFDCGTEDLLLDYNRELHHVMVQIGVEHIYDESSGGHEWSYWSKHVATTLKFFTKIVNHGAI